MDITISIKRGHMENQDLFDNKPKNPNVYPDGKEMPNPGANMGFATTKHLEDNMPEKTTDGSNPQNNGTLWVNKPMPPERLFGIS